MTKKLSALKQSAQAMTTLSVLFENREKGELSVLVENKETVTIREFDLIDLRDGSEPFMAFVCDEYPDNFFFGGKVLTENLVELQGQGYEDAIKEEGLPTQFGKKKGASYEYTTVKFYPEG